MEMADTIVITKADADNRNKAQLAMGEYKNALHLFPPAPSGFIPKVQCCSALEGYGIPEVWQTVLSYENTTKNNGFFAQNRANQEKYRMYEAINEALQDKFYGC